MGLLSAYAILQVNCRPATTVAICERTFCSKSIKFWLNSSAWIAQMSTLFWSCCSLQTLALLVLDKHNKKFTVKDHHPQLAVSKLWVYHPSISYWHICQCENISELKITILRSEVCTLYAALVLHMWFICFYVRVQLFSVILSYLSSFQCLD